jgi:hypothetical protein
MQTRHRDCRVPRAQHLKANRETSRTSPHFEHAFVCRGPAGSTPQYRTDVLKRSLLWSGGEDLNLRSPAPHAGAIPGYATARDRTSIPPSRIVSASPLQPIRSSGAHGYPTWSDADRLIASPPDAPVASSIRTAATQSNNCLPSTANALPGLLCAAGDNSRIRRGISLFRQGSTTDSSPR